MQSQDVTGCPACGEQYVTVTDVCVHGPPTQVCPPRPSTHTAFTFSWLSALYSIKPVWAGQHSPLSIFSVIISM